MEPKLSLGDILGILGRIRSMENVHKNKNSWVNKNSSEIIQ